MTAPALALSILALFTSANPADRPTGLGPATEFTPISAHVTQSFQRTAPPRRPARLAGMGAWSCGTKHGALECTVGKASRRWSAVTIYRAAGRVSSVTVDVGRMRPS